MIVLNHMVDVCRQVLDPANVVLGQRAQGPQGLLFTLLGCQLVYHAIIKVLQLQPRHHAQQPVYLHAQLGGQASEGTALQAPATTTTRGHHHLLPSCLLLLLLQGDQHVGALGCFGRGGQGGQRAPSPGQHHGPQPERLRVLLVRFLQKGVDGGARAVSCSQGGSNHGAAHGAQGMQALLLLLLLLMRLCGVCVVMVMVVVMVVVPDCTPLSRYCCGGGGGGGQGVGIVPIGTVCRCGCRPFLPCCSGSTCVAPCLICASDVGAALEQQRALDACCSSHRI
mmetsp:Transcript_18243/g.51138  ORF Transcript_18243/g.51138 Transcript_18243/m.51138 type:complete len:281 (-) Transcript_18243:4205-5047(-)